MLTWRLKFAWLPTKMDNGVKIWLEQYWEGYRTTNCVMGGITVYMRFPAYQYECNHINEHKKVFVADPDKRYIGRREWDSDLIALNRKEW